MAMPRLARLFKRGVEAALARRVTVKDYLIKDMGRTPEQVQALIDAARAELVELQD